MQLLDSVNAVLWGPFTVILILICGVFHTIKSGFIQLKLLGKLGGSGENRLRAVTSALAASMGTGNITGCAAAIAAGGVGAVFWMWISAALGMAIAYSENKLGAEYSIKYPHRQGGPMLYMEKGLGSRGLARFYAAACLCAALCMGCTSQAGAFAEAVSSQTGVPPLLCAVFASIITGAVIFSSEKVSVGVMNAAEKIVPVMGVLYTVGCIVLIIYSDCSVTASLFRIVSCAFTPEAVCGGAVGITVQKAVSIGLRRGIFSNEAGMGSSVLIHSEADFGSPEGAGAWAAFEVFLDTVVCCTLTALAVMTLPALPEGDVISYAFEHTLGRAGGIFVCVCICLFAWAAILGWSSCGEKSLSYLTSRGTVIYKLLVCAFTAAGGLISMEAVLGVSDIINCMMMIPNLLVITVLTISSDNKNR